jgi:hypothetical protein
MNTEQGGRRPWHGHAGARPWARRAMGWALGIAALLTMGPVAQGAGKLVAPVYPGAVPAVTGKAPGGKPDSCEGRCYLTKDPIEKVKAFYEKAVGPLKQAPQPYGQRSYGVMLEYALRSEEGAEWSALGIHALGPPLNIPSDPKKWQQFYTRAGGPVGPLVHMVAWTRDMEGYLNPYKPKDVDALARKYWHIQSKFYVMDAATGKRRDSVLSDQLRNRIGQLQGQALMGNIATQQSISASMGKEGAKISAEDLQDDPEFNRIMNRKPALSKKYVALTQKTQQQMMTGKYDEAEKTMDEADKLLRSDPDVAKLMQRYDARDKRREAVSANAKAQGSAAEAETYKKSSRQIWDATVKTLEQMVKEGYSTYIVIDYALGGKGVERNRAKLATMDDGLDYPPPEMEREAADYSLLTQELGIKPVGDSPEKVAAAREASKPAGAGKPAARQQQAEQKPQAQPEKKSGASEAAKKGLKMFKKLF